MFTKIQKRMKGDKGFTLIELLVVIIIIAILAAIAIPTFLGQRQKAQDAAAKSLVRNAMTTLESAYVDGRTYAVADTVLSAIEPSIKFNTATVAVVNITAAAGTLPATGTFDAAVTVANGADAGNNSVMYFGDDTSFSVATISLSTNTFGVYTNKSAPDGGTTFLEDIGDGPIVGW